MDALPGLHNPGFCPGSAQFFLRHFQDFAQVEAWEGVHVSGTKDNAYYYSSYHMKDESPVDMSRPKVMMPPGRGPRFL